MVNKEKRKKEKERNKEKEETERNRKRNKWMKETNKQNKTKQNKTKQTLESMGVFFTLLTFLLFMRSTHANSSPYIYAILAAVSYFFLVSVWEGYVFSLNVIPVYIGLCILLSLGDSQLYTVKKIKQTRINW